MKNFTSDPRFVLLMSCSDAKKPTPGLLPAWDRYQGRLFIDLRTWINDPAIAVLPTVLILSAELGLIDLTTEIPHYGARMTPQRTQKIISDRYDPIKFRQRLAQAEQVLSVAGRSYDRVFREWMEPPYNYVWEDRGIGYKRQSLRRFLERTTQRRVPLALAS